MPAAEQLVEWRRRITEIQIEVLVVQLMEPVAGLKAQPAEAKVIEARM